MVAARAIPGGGKRCLVGLDAVGMKKVRRKQRGRKRLSERCAAFWDGQGGKCSTELVLQILREKKKSLDIICVCDIYICLIIKASSRTTAAINRNPQ